jgi:L-galactono-1,4-lactone dehydrogenase
VCATSTKRLYRPETEAELETLVVQAHKDGTKLRCVGTALSPNGLALCDGGMVSLTSLDKVVKVDETTGLVTVQAGATVAAVVQALRPHGLTLRNFASIDEQQMGGFVQVGAHGTGATIGPVDEQVVGFKIVTPGQSGHLLSLSLSLSPPLCLPSLSLSLSLSLLLSVCPFALN